MNDNKYLLVNIINRELYSTIMFGSHEEAWYKMRENLSDIVIEEQIDDICTQEDFNAVSDERYIWRNDFACLKNEAWANTSCGNYDWWIIEIAI